MTAFAVLYRIWRASSAPFVSWDEWDRIQTALEAARKMSALIWSGAPATEYDEAHDALDRALVAIESSR